LKWNNFPVRNYNINFFTTLLCNQLKKHTIFIIKGKKKYCSSFLGNLSVDFCKIKNAFLNICFAKFLLHFYVMLSMAVFTDEEFNQNF
jgi:hypothetical protein